MVYRLDTQVYICCRFTEVVDVGEEDNAWGRYLSR